jgi:hypothetical protein
VDPGGLTHPKGQPAGRLPWEKRGQEWSVLSLRANSARDLCLGCKTFGSLRIEMDKCGPPLRFPSGCSISLMPIRRIGHFDVALDSLVEDTGQRSSRDSRPTSSLRVGSRMEGSRYAV